jgi:hypothetical protein
MTESKLLPRKTIVSPFSLLFLTSHFMAEQILATLQEW